MLALGPLILTRQRGFSLFEVLITVIVISIGLLGLAGLQFAGLRAVNSAQDHTQATLLAQDIAERIHANPGSSYDGILLNSSSVVPAQSCDQSTDCTTGAMLNYDKYSWQEMVDHSLLANLQIAINHTGSSPSDYYTVTLTWGNGDNQQTLVESFAP